LLFQAKAGAKSLVSEIGPWDAEPLWSGFSKVGSSGAQNQSQILVTACAMPSRGCSAPAGKGRVHWMRNAYSNRQHTMVAAIRQDFLQRTPALRAPDLARHTPTSSRALA